jgi:hypothetical protein
MPQSEQSMDFKDFQSLKSRQLEVSGSIPNVYFNASIHERDELMQPELIEDMPMNPHISAKDNRQSKGDKKLSQDIASFIGEYNR